jgi:hypothetical protein
VRTRVALGLSTTAVVVALALGACDSTYPGATVGQQVHSWATTSPDPKFGSARATLQNDLKDVALLEAQGNYGALKAECDALVTDALEANQNLPTPDSKLTNLLSSTYNSAVASGQDCFCAAGGTPCRDGAGSKDAYLARSAREAAATERGLISAEARVDELSSPNSD